MTGSPPVSETPTALRERPNTDSIRRTFEVVVAGPTLADAIESLQIALEECSVPSCGKCYVRQRTIQSLLSAARGGL